MDCCYTCLPRYRLRLLVSSGNILKVFFLMYLTFSGSIFPFPSFPFKLHATLSVTENSCLFRFAEKFIRDELLFSASSPRQYSNMMVDHEQQLLMVWGLLFQGVPPKMLVAVWGVLLKRLVVVWGYCFREYHRKGCCWCW